MRVSVSASPGLKAGRRRAVSAGSANGARPGAGFVAWFQVACDDGLVELYRAREVSADGVGSRHAGVHGALRIDAATYAGEAEVVADIPAYGCCYGVRRERLH